MHHLRAELQILFRAMTMTDIYAETVSIPGVFGDAQVICDDNACVQAGERTSRNRYQVTYSGISEHAEKCI